MDDYGLDCTILRNVAVPMRDGVKLATTVFLPRGAGAFPTVMVRTAYNRIGSAGAGPLFARNGYAFVVQDCRGRYDSEGEWYPFTSEGRDGFDTLEWLAAQPWCNGKVGMFGASYLAATQFLLAPERSPCLRSLIPCFMTGDCWQRAYYCDGVFSLALTWSWLCFEVQSRTSDAGLLPAYDLAKLLRARPVIDLDRMSGYDEIPFWRDYVRHGSWDEYWQALSLRDKYAAFDMPVLLVGGWYDYYAGETFTNYLGMIENARTLQPGARAAAPPASRGGAQYQVLIGPWTHGFNGSRWLGQVDFGPASVLDANALYLRHFDRTLKGEQLDPGAPIRIFVMGINEWRDEQEWPLARTRFTRYYLHSGGRANTLLGDGALTPEAPADEPADGYVYDPDDPVPTLGGNHSVGPYNPGLYEMALPGPYDQRPLERRDDVLVYTSPPLPEDTEVTGPVKLKLFASSSAPDTDWVAKLVDVYPDGRAINITEGALRARFRERVWDRPALLAPGQVYEFEIDLTCTSNVFAKGHRIRIDVTSSNFPLLAPNPNTGGEPGRETDAVAAKQTILHDREHPSHVLLPIVP